MTAPIVWGIMTPWSGSPPVPVVIPGEPYTDQALLQQIQYTVIEPPDGGVTWPSGLWTREEVLNYLNQRQNRFLKETHLQFGIALIQGVVGTIYYDLPWDWIATVRVLWINDEGETSALMRSDTWEADNGIPTWSYVKGLPKIYYDGGAPISLAIMPPPDGTPPVTPGTIQIHYVPTAVDLTGDGEILTIPNEFVPSVKYGGLADMLMKVGRAQDPRAQYCSQRYQLGVEIARLLVKGFK